MIDHGREAVRNLLALVCHLAANSTPEGIAIEDILGINVIGRRCRTPHRPIAVSGRTPY